MLDRDALKAFRAAALNPEHPVTRGTAQNPDIYFQTREASNKFYDAVPDMVAEAMTEISKITGREYKPFTYYGAADAENIVVAMGSGDRDPEGDGRLPEGARGVEGGCICVLDRTPGANGTSTGCRGGLRFSADGTGGCQQELSGSRSSAVWTDKYCQAYISSTTTRRSRAATPRRTCVSAIRPITSRPTFVTTPDFVACRIAFVRRQVRRAEGPQEGRRSFLLNSVHDAETTCGRCPTI